MTSIYDENGKEIVPKCRQCNAIIEDNDGLVFTNVNGSFFICYDCMDDQMKVHFEVKSYARDNSSGWQPIDTAPKNELVLLGWNGWNRSRDPDLTPILGYWDSDKRDNNQRVWVEASRIAHMPVKTPDYWIPIPSIPGDSI